jgi:surface antigen
VIDLTVQIQAQKEEQEKLRTERESELRRLEETKRDRSDLLEKTEGQESAYQSMVSQLTAEQAEVNKQLFAAIRLEAGDGSSGGYPYANSPFSMETPGCPAGDGPDRWGYCTRQCVSYAAWAVERAGKQAPKYWGNAKNWKWHAEEEGYRVDNTPEEGAVAVYTSGYFGHVQYVETVYGNGTMRISQYNAQLTGQYSEATVPSSRYDLWFIHF